MNWYAYVGMNPVTGDDPFGLVLVADDILEGIGLCLATSPCREVVAAGMAVATVAAGKAIEALTRDLPPFIGPTVPYSPPASPGPYPARQPGGGTLFFPKEICEPFPVIDPFPIHNDPLLDPIMAKSPREQANEDHAKLRDRLRKEQSGYEPGRHDQYPAAMRDALRRMADAADARGVSPEYGQRLREIANTYDKRAKAAHRGGRRR